MKRGIVEVQVNEISTEIEVDWAFADMELFEDEIFCVPVDSCLEPFYTHYKSLVVADKKD